MFGQDSAFPQLLRSFDAEIKIDELFKNADFIKSLNDFLDKVVEAGQITASVCDDRVFIKIAQVYYQKVDFESDDKVRKRCDVLFQIPSLKEKVNPRHFAIYELLQEAYFKKKEYEDGKISREEWQKDVLDYLNKASGIEKELGSLCKAECEKLCFEIKSFQEPSKLMSVFGGAKNPKEENIKKMLGLLQSFPIAKFYNFIALRLSEDNPEKYAVKRAVVSGAISDIDCVEEFVKEAADLWQSKPQLLIDLSRTCVEVVKVSGGVCDEKWLERNIKSIADAAIYLTHDSAGAKYQKSIGKEPNFSSVMRPLVEGFCEIYEHKKLSEFILAAAFLIKKGPCEDVSLVRAVANSCFSIYKDTKDQEFILAAASLVKKDCWNDFALANEMLVACVDGCKNDESSKGLEDCKNSLKESLKKISKKAPDLTPASPRAVGGASKNVAGGKVV